MPGSIFESLFNQIRNAAVPQQVQAENSRMLGLAQSDPAAFVQQLKQPPMRSGDLVSDLGGVMPIAGMAKAFKPGASTIEGMIQDLVKNEATFPGRSRLLPTIHVPATAEQFVGELGGNHPTDAAIAAFTRRNQPAGGFEYGFRLPYEGSPFVPETLANYLTKPGNPETVHRLLSQGMSPQTITEVIIKRMSQLMK